MNNNTLHTMRSPFFKKHVELNAKMIDFYGWEMPIQYSGIIDEHKNVRENVGLFDVSHMGRFRIKGDGAEQQIQNLITNDISKINDNQAIYSPMCNESGGIIDDIIIGRINVDEFLIVVNSSNIKKDFLWIKQNIKCDVEDITDEFALLALQGPKANQVLTDSGIKQIEDLRPFHLLRTRLWNIECIISRTGYTGEDGFEIFFDANQEELWDKLLHAGSKYGIKPIGLGARDTLRLEAGLMLYGNDIDENTTPLEAPLKWTVKFETDFIGKKALQEKNVKQKLRGFEIIDSKRVARKGNEVFDANDKIGKVSSGSFSPTFNKPIGFCFVPAEFSLDKKIKIDIGGKFYDSKLTSTRFYKR